MVFIRPLSSALCRSQSAAEFPVLLLLRPLSSASSTLSAVKELREKSGAPIADVKAALDQTSYDQEEAYQLLRKRGLAAATKKASRRAAEGLIGLAKDTNSAALVEVNSETDFVARNEHFKSLVSMAAQTALRAEAETGAGPSGAEIPVSVLASSRTPSGKRLEEQVQEVAASVREHIRVRRAFRLDAPQGVLATYLHSSTAPGLGRIGTMVSLEALQQPVPEATLAQVKEAGNKLAMHAAAARPQFLDASAVPEAALEAERSVLRDQAAKTGKPANIIERMIEGRLKKYFEEVCFLDQAFIMDDALKVRDVLKALSKEVGTQVSLTGFVRLQCGEGLEEDDKKGFASEVRETLEQVA